MGRIGLWSSAFRFVSWRSLPREEFLSVVTDQWTRPRLLSPECNVRAPASLSGGLSGLCFLRKRPTSRVCTTHCPAPSGLRCGGCSAVRRKVPDKRRARLKIRTQRKRKRERLSVLLAGVCRRGSEVFFLFFFLCRRVAGGHDRSA